MHGTGDKDIFGSVQSTNRAIEPTLHIFAAVSFLTFSHPHTHTHILVFSLSAVVRAVERILGEEKKTSGPGTKSIIFMVEPAKRLQVNTIS